MINLNIKSEEAKRLAAELARETGESITAAVTTAIRERLANIRSRPSGQDLLSIGRDCAGRLKEPWKSASIGDLLYDEHGLPR
jgi:antitoxin VapB